MKLALTFIIVFSTLVSAQRISPKILFEENSFDFNDVKQNY